MKTKEIETMPINQELLALIAPQGIDIKSSRVQMGEFLSKIQYISGYPSRVNVGWLLSLKDIPNTIVSLVVTPIEDVQGFVEGVSKGITTDKNTYNTTQNEFLKTQAEYKIASAETMIREITIDNIPYINLSFLAKTNGNTENNFTENMRIVKNKIAGMGLKARLPAFQQELALKQASPYDVSYEKITDISNKQMSLAALFKGLPFSGSGLIDEKGYYIGTDEDGRAIILDTFIKSPDRPNSNITISGASGSGKSYLAKKIMLNEWMNGCKFYILDPESEYKAMCKEIGGKWIDCSGGKGKNVGRINPLQVNKLPKNIEDENEEYNSTKSALALHMDFLTAFFSLYFPEITSFQMSLLMEILEELYKKFNIDYDTNIDNIPKDKFPIMKDLYEILEIKVNDKNTQHRDEIEIIKSIVRSLAIGHNAEIFNGHTTVEEDNDFICLDIYSLQGASANIKSCQYLNMLRYCEDMAFRNREEKCYVVCDEAYLLIDKKVPQAIEFMRNFSKRCRKYECGLITISQNILDFLADEIKQYGQAILDNSTYKFFFGTDGQDLEEIVRIYNLNTEEKTILSQKDRGRGLMFVGPGHSLINVKAEEWEKPYLIGGGK